MCVLYFAYMNIFRYLRWKNMERETRNLFGVLEKYYLHIGCFWNMRKNVENPKRSGVKEMPWGGDSKRGHFFLSWSLHVDVLRKAKIFPLMFLWRAIYQVDFSRVRVFKPWPCRSLSLDILEYKMCFCTQCVCIRQSQRKKGNKRSRM